MREILIKTPKGLMRIYPDKFFPKTQTELNKVIRCIRDPWTGDGEEKIQEIVEYLRIRIKELKDKSSHYETLHNSMCTDTEDPFDLEYLKKHGDLVVSIVNRISSTIKKLEKNLDYMRKV